MRRGIHEMNGDWDGMGGMGRMGWGAGWEALERGRETVGVWGETSPSGAPGMSRGAVT